jgi:hypothetical protein
VTHDQRLARELEAASLEGCAVCRRSEAASCAALAHLAYELVNDVGVRGELAASWGFCREHASVFAAQTSAPLAVAIIYGDLAARLASLLERARAPAVVTRALEQRTPCPICVLGARREADDVAVVRARGLVLSSPVHGDHPRAARPHALPTGAPRSDALPLGVLLAHAPSSGLRFLRSQARAYAEIAVRLERVVRHHDYRFANEAFTDWGVCWEALYLFSGTDPDGRPG